MDDRIETHYRNCHICEAVCGLAIEIANWWRERGYEVEVWVEPIPLKFVFDRPVYSVRSNMVNGVPPRVMSMVRAA